MPSTVIQALFLDVGGVLLTNGWDSKVRHALADRFHLDLPEFEARHHLTFDTYEEGKISFDVFLERTVFYKPRNFTPADFKKFVSDFTQPFPEMIEMFKRLKAKHGLKIAVVSNEGRELTFDRVQRFGLKSFVDFFIVSSFVHLRKPDNDIYQLALDVAMLEPQQVAYIDDRAMLVEVASKMGIVGIQHSAYDSTKARLAELGLVL
ncbi:MAG TPA: HAD-IA family hydrolase [Pirellulales bacterium]|nr:HAD-IA family hydrolase [Pirellulales bacterium]